MPAHFETILNHMSLFCCAVHFWVDSKEWKQQCSSLILLQAFMGSYCFGRLNDLKEQFRRQLKFVVCHFRDYYGTENVTQMILWRWIQRGKGRRLSIWRQSFLVSASYVTIPNRDSLFNIDTGVNPGIRVWKKHIYYWALCQKAIGGICFTQKERAETL